MMRVIGGVVASILVVASVLAYLAIPVCVGIVVVHFVLKLW